jgi:hypothetical protein
MKYKTPITILNDPTYPNKIAIKYLAMKNEC